MVGPGAAHGPARPPLRLVTAPAGGMRTLATVLVLGGLLVVLDTTVTIVAIPELVEELDSTLPVVQWVTGGYVLALVAVLPAAAWLMLRFGTRTTYLTALVVFVAASVLAGLAWDVGSLIGFRVVQGLGGGLLGPVGMAIALRAAPRDRRGRMMSLLGLPVVIGPVLGLPLSGLLLDTASWRWIFWVVVPFGLVALLLGARAIPADDPRRPVPQLDRAGLALLPAGAVLVVLGLTLVGESGRLDPAAGAALAGGTALGAAFVVRALRIRAPLLDLRLLRQRSFAVGCATLFCFGAAYFGAMAVPAVFVQGVRGDPAVLAGVLGIPQALATGLTLQVATRLVDRVPARRVVLFGITTALVGTAAVAATIALNGPYPVLAAAGVVLGAGSGATIMPTMTVALRDLNDADSPGGAALMGLVQQFATAVGGAVTAGLLVLSITAAAPELGGGGVGAMLAVDDATRARLEGELATATAWPYSVPLVLTLAALLLAAVGLRGDRAEAGTRTEAGAETEAGAGADAGSR